MIISNLLDIEAILHNSDTTDLPISGFACDSRNVKHGNLFFALSGAKVDGTDFLSAAAHNGAQSAVVPSTYDGPDFGLQLVRVPNVLLALQQLAAAVIKKLSHAKIIGITGSLGKTTVKGFVETLLSEKFKVMATPGSSNSQIGLPLAILNGVQGDEDFLVLEMGMSEKGGIRRLVQFAPPDIACITTIAKAHYVYFNGEHEIAEAKSEILENCHLGMIPLDTPYTYLFSETGLCPKISFSMKDSFADYYLDPEGTVNSIKGNVSLLDLQVPGTHNAYNALIAVSLALEAGMDPAEIQAVIPKLRLPPMRLEKTVLNEVVFINDSYNAGPQSMKAAIACLPSPELGAKRIGVIGEMLELGDYSQEAHLDVAQYALGKVDLLLCMGKGTLPMVEYWKEQGKEAMWFPSREELVASLRTSMVQKDVVLLKGSRLNQLWKVLEEV